MWTLDGVSDYLSTTSGIVLAMPMTFACFARTTHTSSAQVLIQLSRTNLASTQYALSFISTGTPDEYRVYAHAKTTSPAFTTTTFQKGEMVHAAAVFVSGTERYAYLNGGGKGVAIVNRNPLTPTRGRIGRRANNTQKLTGDIGWAAIWDVALTDFEILALSNGASPTRVREGSLNMLATMNHAVGSTVYDAHGSARSYAVNGAPVLSLDRGAPVQPPWAWDLNEDYAAVAALVPDQVCYAGIEVVPAVRHQGVML